MRKIDKKLNIAKANLLNEQRYLNLKEGINEDWKTNVAAGLATVGGVAANAQQAPQQAPQSNKVIQHQAPQQDKSKVANPYDVNDTSLNFPQTKQIVKIQTGVQDGKTGEPSVYVYSKDPSDPSFNVATDRETVYMKNINNLTRTSQYQDYMKRLAAKKKQTSPNTRMASDID